MQIGERGVRTIESLFKTQVDLSIFEPYKIDCENCCGLCCVVLYFSKLEGFPDDKEAGNACKNLQQDYTCSIHAQLSEQGLKGCMAYDCFGAGQQVTRLLAKMPNWNERSADDTAMIFKAYLKVMQMQQTLWYLAEASLLSLPELEERQIKLLLEEGRIMIKQPLERLQTLDAELFREKANHLLKQICTMINRQYYADGKIRMSEDSHKNYMGKNMKRKNLTGQDFSMSLLLAANLEQADLRGANFLGADLRDANLCNTDLSQCLFLTQIQMNSARGNQNTKIPSYLCRPASWE